MKKTNADYGVITTYAFNEFCVLSGVPENKTRSINYKYKRYSNVSDGWATILQYAIRARTVLSSTKVALCKTGKDKI